MFNEVIEGIARNAIMAKLTLRFREFDHKEEFGLSEGGSFSLMMPEYGRFNDKSEIIIKAEAPASLTQDSDNEGETETAENVSSTTTGTPP